MILAKTYYKSYNNKFLAIIKGFKTWHYNLKYYKYKLFILKSYNNYYYFIN